MRKTATSLPPHSLCQVNTVALGEGLCSWEGDAQVHGLTLILRLASLLLKMSTFAFHILHHSWHIFFNSMYHQGSESFEYCENRVYRLELLKVTGIWGCSSKGMCILSELLAPLKQGWEDHFHIPTKHFTPGPWGPEFLSEGKCLVKLFCLGAATWGFSDPRRWWLDGKRSP